MQAVRRHTDCKWVLLYLQRWLEAPVSMPEGTLRRDPALFAHWSLGPAVR